MTDSSQKFDIFLRKKAGRVKQRAELLISRADFQKDINDLRIKWGIPKEGFDDEESYRLWQLKISEDTDKYFETEWPRFKEKQITKDYHIEEKEFNKRAPLNAIDQDIKKLIQTYRLPLGWKYSLHRYLELNKIELMNLSCGISVHSEYDQDIDYSTLFIEIEDDTTIEEVKAFWPEIKAHQKRLESYKKGKFQPIKQFDRDRLAYELRGKGVPLANIAKELTAKFGIEYGWDEISRFVERHKEKSGIN